MTEPAEAAPTARFEPESVLVTAFEGSEPAVSGLTYRRFAPLLTAGDDQVSGRCFGMVARTADGRPVGLALAWSPDATEDEARTEWLRLMSIFVDPERRRQGLGRRLIAALCADAAARGYRKLVAFHSNRQAGRDAYEALMSGTGWDGPDIHQWRLTGRVGWSLQPDAALERARAHVLRQGYRLWPLAETGCPGFAAMDALASAGRVEPTFAPLPDRRMYDPAATFTIMRGDDVVGWVLGSPFPGRDDPGLLYPEATVLPDLRRTGWLPVALQDVCRIQAARFGEHSPASYTTGRREMFSFMHRRLIGRHGSWVVDHDYRARFVRRLP